MKVFVIIMTVFYNAAADYRVDITEYEHEVFITPQECEHHRLSKAFELYLINRYRGKDVVEVKTKCKFKVIPMKGA